VWASYYRRQSQYDVNKLISGNVKDDHSLGLTGKRPAVMLGGNKSQELVDQAALTEAVRFESIRILLDGLTTIIGGSIASCLFMLTWLSSYELPLVAVGWIYGLLALNIPLIFIRFSRRQAEKEQLLRFARVFVALRIFSGLLWIVGFLILVRVAEPGVVWTIIAVFCGLGIAVVSTQITMPVAIVGFMAPVLTVMLSYYLLFAPGFESGLIVSLLIYAASVCKLARDQYHSTLRDMRIRQNEKATLALLGKQSAELNKLVVELTRLMSMKDLFMATVSLDLRQPAQAIVLLADSMEPVQDVEAVKSRLQNLKAASGQINDVIARLLDLSTLDRDKGEPIPAWFSLDEMLAKIARIVEPKATAAPIEILHKPSPGLTICADAQYVERIVQNLVINAIEHSKGTRITISTRISEASPENLQLTIADDGIGTEVKPTDTHGQIDVDRKGLDESAVLDSGRGLGLAIAQRLAYLGGYNFEIESSPGEGTCFYIGFSQYRIDSKPKPHSGQGPRSGNDKLATVLAVENIDRNLHYPDVVLVIEDDPLVRVALQAMIAALPIRVLLAADLAAAFEQLSEHNNTIDLVLADWHLTGGETAADVLPKVFACLQRPCPVIILSGEREEHVSVNTLGARLGDVPIRFLQKPVSPLALARAMSDLNHLARCRDL